MTEVTTSAINELESLADQLPPGGKKFALSLVKQARQRGLTVRQEPYVAKLIEQAKNPPKPVTAKVRGDMGKAYSFFFSARSHLRFPKVVVKAVVGGEEAEDVKIHMAGPASKKPDMLNITLPERTGRYGRDVWLGRIDAAGNWEIPQQFADDTGLTEPVKKLLSDLGKNPHKVASEHGQLTGNCCFCSRRLTDDRSTGVGYGETCASHYGLHAQWKKGKGAKSVKKTGQRRVRTGRKSA
jgi:hypothetical protein